MFHHRPTAVGEAPNPLRTVIVDRPVLIEEFGSRKLDSRSPLVSAASFGRAAALLIGQPKPVGKSVEQAILLAIYFSAVIGNEVQQRKEELFLSYCLFCHENLLSENCMPAGYYRNLT